MAKSIGLSYPLCLGVNDPADMLAVEIPHARFPQDDPARFCRLCVLAIMRSAVASELINAWEVFGDDAASDNPSDGGAATPLGAEASPPVVPEDQPGAGPPAVDRREPEVPAGGEDATSLIECECCGTPHAESDLTSWAGPNAPNMRVCSDCADELEAEL